MNYKSLKKYSPANTLDRMISLKWRERIKNLFIDLTIVLFIWFLVSPFYTPTHTALTQGLFLISFGISLLLICFESFYYDLYFDDLPTIFQEPHFKNPEMNGSYLLSEIINNTGMEDVVSGLFRSMPGKLLALRLDIPFEDLDSFIANKKNKINLDQLEIQTEDKSDLFESYVTSIYNQDKEFKDFVFQYSIKEKDLSGTARWITKQYEKEKRSRRWWGRDNLSKTDSIGKDWSYGKAFILEKYALEIEDLYDFSSYGLGKHKKEVDEIENILSRKSEANILLISDDEFQKIDILVEFSKKIMSGKLPALQNKRVFVLDINDVIVGKKTKPELEEEIINIFNGAERAGNIILVIKNLPSALLNSRALESDLLGLIGPYLDSSSLQNIALSDTKSFHQYIENNISAMQKFETILLKEDTEDNLIYGLQKRTAELEQKYDVFFTYPSLVAIAENVTRYFMGQIISDKALDILIELPQFVLKQNKKIITKKDVLDMVQTKTGIPVGEIKEKEKNKLLNLEKILHERVISQDEAIVAIGSTLRRARSGIESANKPLGSFLFLGPTGVGKTETAKALSEVFFDSDEKIIRLDMSEYSGPDSLSRLLGSFETGKQGVLSSLLRENQYGVLLLDEFEKANHEVHNLFLQILDEGIFSDMVGKKVNARNLIIIATSNAGSNIIWDYVKESKNLAENKQKIVDEIVHEGLFKPELINRFDGVILFHPLNDVDLKQITILMLKKLAKRLEEKSLDLVITDELVDYLVQKGSDPMFGARPINRAIQDNVEEIIARKLIGGNIKPGEKVTISKEELESTNSK
ncbi:MAG: AAA family ATPase [Candidatus Zambryskibacteria bacterium]|nr:AAA family ATPase [Candidatus Zambryskibacteria bacterium]